MSIAQLALTTIESSLRATLAMIVILTLHRTLLRRATAHARRALLLAAVVAVPALPVLGATAPRLLVSLPISVDPRPLLSRLAAAVSMIPFPPAEVVALVWATGASIMLSRLVVGWASVRRQARAAEPLRDPVWLAECDRIAKTLGLRRAPELRRCRHECMPYAWGWLHPMVVLPDSAVLWSTDRRRAVLAHELGHLLRGDPPARFVVDLVRALHWFDPLLRRAARDFRQQAEFAADDAALSLGFTATEYAEVLATLAAERWRMAVPRATPALAAPREVEARVRRVLELDARSADGARVPPIVPVALATVAVGLMALSAVPRLAPAASPGSPWSDRFGIPLVLAEVIARTARQEGIDPGLAFGLVAEESAFDSAKISANGAIGLTQMLPETARLIAPGLTIEELRDDAINLRIGFRFLRAQIEREHGDVARGLTAYALGYGRIEALRARGEPVPSDYSTRVLAHLD